MLSAQLREQQKQMQVLDNQLMDLASSKKALDDFGTVEKGKEILMPIGPGIFAKAKLEDNKDVVMNVGAGTVVKKSLDETKKLLEKQFINVQKVQTELLESIQKLSTDIEKLQKEVSSPIK